MFSTRSRQSAPSHGASSPHTASSMMSSSSSLPGTYV
jgi:hypothetical protein